MLTILDHWQTLITGILALIGAGATILALRAQAKQEAARKRKGARVMLPATFVEVFAYALACIRWLESLREKAALAEKGALRGSIPVGTSPRPNTAITAQLRECVENFQGTSSDFIASLLFKLQIQYSRVASLQDYFDNF